VSECIKRTCYKELWNILTCPSSVVRNGSSSSTQFLPKRSRQLRNGCRGTFWPSSVQRIGFQGVQTSKPWTINCGLLWRTWHVESVTTAQRAWGDPSWRLRQRSPWRRRVRQEQGGQSISRLASGHRAAILCDIIINENLKLLQIHYLAWKVDVLFNFPYVALCTCNRLMARLCRYTLSCERLMELHYWAKAIVCFSQNWVKKELLGCTEYKIRIMSSRNGCDLSLHMWVFSNESATGKWVTGLLKVLT